MDDFRLIEGKDTSLIERIRQGDYSAFQELFDNHYEDLVRYAGLRVPSQDVAQGLVQEVVVRIWERRATWNPKGALRAYLYAMVRNACIAYERKQRRRSRLFNAWVGWGNRLEDAPDNRYQVEEMNYAAQQAIEAMPSRRKEIYSLSRQYGLTYKEIAAMLGISTKTVEAQMGSALKFLRERLKPYL
ncbi:MAG: RNA polymerase sigma-70 factor [Rhodothermaceae bacterium]|nr:RNA polymerase sigma-70 factor [Rhodothermaceae bacterium]